MRLEKENSSKWCYPSFELLQIYIKLENEFALQNSGALCGGIYWVVKYDQRRCNLLEAPRHVTAHYGETFPFSIWSGDLVRQRQETHKIA